MGVASYGGRTEELPPDAQLIARGGHVGFTQVDRAVDTNSDNDPGHGNLTNQPTFQIAYCVLYKYATTSVSLVLVRWAYAYVAKT
eukprot:scaffold234715_cov27-Tisochrysis_lutea.AAC.1